MTKQELQQQNNYYISNQLITNIDYYLIKESLKILEIALTKIDFYDTSEKNNIVTLEKTEIYKLLDLKHSQERQRFNSSLKQVVKNTVVDVEIEGRQIIAPIATIEYDNHGTTIDVVFDKRFMPLLKYNNQNYTKYLLDNILKLDTISIPLFKLLAMNINIYNAKPYENNLCYKNPVISLAKMRSLTGTVDESGKTTKYSRIATFNHYCVKKIIEDINLNTNLTIEYEYVQGNKTYQFYIQEKSVYEIPQLEQKDLMAYLPEAMKDPYIKILIDNELIAYDQVEDICSIYINVVPKYDKINNKYYSTLDRNPFGIIERHIKHIKIFMLDENINEYHKNITKYLLESISSYENKIENRRVQGIEEREE